MSYSETKSEPVINIPISGAIDSFNDLISLMDDIRADKFFTVSNSFTISDAKSKDSDGYEFNINMTNVVDTDDEEEKLAVMNGSSTATVEKATEASTAK